jgi:hypothetical protein
VDVAKAMGRIRPLPLVFLPKLFKLKPFPEKFTESFNQQKERQRLKLKHGRRQVIPRCHAERSEVSRMRVSEVFKRGSERDSSLRPE